jgi:hypothetical protein
LHSGDDAWHSAVVMVGGTREIRVRSGDAQGRRPDWLREFRFWLGGRSPSAIADVIDELARELEARNLGGNRALSDAADLLRAHQAARVGRLVDAFLTAPVSAATRQSATAESAGQPVASA